MVDLNSWNALNITVLELCPIVAAVEMWGVAWANSSVCFFTDNNALVAIINRETSKEPCVMVLMRKLILSCLRSNIQQYQVVIILWLTNYPIV